MKFNDNDLALIDIALNYAMARAKEKIEKEKDEDVRKQIKCFCRSWQVLKEEIAYHLL